MLSKLLQSLADNNYTKELREYIFKKIQKILNITIKEIENDTKTITKKILQEAELNTQKQMVNEVLKRQKESLEKTKPSKDIQKEREEFRLQMYQATQSRAKQNQQGKDNTKTFSK